MDKKNVEKIDIILNVRIYRLIFPEESEYDSRMRQEEIRTLFRIVNTVWALAGIHWKVLAIQKKNINTPGLPSLNTVSERKELRMLFGRISPIVPSVIQQRIWNVCLLNSFPLPSWGVYLPETRTVFFSESSNRQSRPNAVTLAHELGHMLGLQHVPFDGNLMNQRALKEMQRTLSSLGKLKKLHLNADQIAFAREQSVLGPYEKF